VRYDTTTSAVAVAWTLAGRVARRDRTEFEAQIEPATGAVREAMDRATDAAHHRLVELIRDCEDEEHAEATLLSAGTAAIAEALEDRVKGTPLRDDLVAWLSLLVESTAVRDMAWSLILGSDAAVEHHRALWQEVLHRSEPDLIVAPATLFAFAAWRCGDGGIARLALERALAVDPHYRMAELLHDLLAQGVPPSTMDEPAPDVAVKRRRGVPPRKRSSTRRARTPRA
jgi:hypothetical protein